MKTILILLIHIAMSAQSFTPKFEGFSTPPVVNCLDIICGDVVTIVFEPVKPGISNSTILRVYMPYISTEYHKDIVFILNNGVIEAAFLTIKEGTNVAEIVPARHFQFTASGAKAVWFRTSYKIKPIVQAQCSESQSLTASQP